jgi:fumarate hydratase class II
MLSRFTASLLIVALLAASLGISSLAEAKDSAASVPRALAQINPAEMEPIADAQAEAIRGEFSIAWQLWQAFLSL